MKNFYQVKKTQEGKYIVTKGDKPLKKLCKFMIKKNMEFDTEEEAKLCIEGLYAAIRSDEEYIERF
jgi:hypothetical protein